jgi:hypothetical protein
LIAGKTGWISGVPLTMDWSVTRRLDTDAAASLRLEAATLLRIAARVRHPVTAGHLCDLAAKCLDLANEIEQERRRGTSTAGGGDGTASQSAQRAEAKAP